VEGEFFGEGRLNGQPLALQNEMQLNVFSIAIIEEIIQVNQANTGLLNVSANTAAPQRAAALRARRH
jgi:hypothetical protein